MTIAVHLKRISSDEQLKQAFNTFDKNKSGYIEFEELREALFEDHEEHNCEQAAHEIILDADLDKVIPFKFVNFYQLGKKVLLKNMIK